jgi:YidC/Oxa1 family membrane protein insertase
VKNPLTPLYDAVAWVIQQIHTGLSHFMSPGSGFTWVLTIVILVVLMRLVLVPLFVKQMHATRKMSALAPQIAELRKKYKNDKQTLNQETMRLYKENGANPLSGCLPLLAQMPLFFALFSVLRAIANWKPGMPGPYGLSTSVVISAQHADILGAHIPDKFLFPVPGQTLESRLVILVAVLISVTTTFLTVRQSTKRGMTPQMTPDNPMAQSQKYMAYIVPLFALSGLYWAFGLVMYWVTTNIWTLGQQYVLFRRYPMPTPATAGGPAPAGAPAIAPGKVTPGAKAAPGKPAPGKAASGRAASGKAVSGKAATGGKAAAGKPATGAGKATTGADGQQGSANGSGPGVLRRFGKGRPEPEPPPPEPETKLVRQQRTRQSRSKRSGKR